MTDQKKSDQTTSSEKPWGGRFSEPTDAFVEKFTASVGFDQRLYHHDITGSIAHATMLAEVGVLTNEERDQIIEGLNWVKADIEAGNFQWSVSLEDVHMNIEARLTDRIGITGKKLHTGRSRNDQVATDLRLWTLRELTDLSALVTSFQDTLASRADDAGEAYLPGYTHLQQAQPVLLAHHLLAHGWACWRWV